MAFFKPTGPNNAAIDIDAMPASMFIDVNNVVDVCQVKIMTKAQRKELAHGEPDVIITSAIQGRSRISRRQLAENFVFINNKKIRLAILREDRVYTVKRYCNVPCKAFKLPSNVVGVCNGRKITDKGAYIVAQVGADGNIDRSTFKVMSSDNFRKLFKIPEQEVITRNRGKGHKELNINHIKELYVRAKGRKRTAPRPSMQIGEQPIQNQTFAGNPNPFANAKPGNGLSQSARMAQQISSDNAANPFAKVQSQGNPFAKLAKQPMQAPVNQEVQKYPFKVTKALYNITGERLVGYTVQRKADGKEVDKTVDKVKEMCAKRLVENVVLVSNNPNDTSLASKYLRGNGISLEKLPRKLIQVR